MRRNIDMECPHCGAVNTKRRFERRYGEYRGYRIHVDCECGASTHVYSWGYEPETKTWGGCRFSSVMIPKELIEKVKLPATYELPPKEPMYYRISEANWDLIFCGKRDIEEFRIGGG